MAQARRKPAEAFAVLVLPPHAEEALVFGPFESADDAGRFVAAEKARSPFAPVFACRLHQPAASEENES